MAVATRIANYLTARERRHTQPTFELDNRLAERAHRMDARRDANDAAAIAEIVRAAWAAGRDIPLSDGYGPTHWKGETFRSAPFPYYHFLAGLVRTQDIHRIFEVGTHYGGSSLAMLHGMAEPARAEIVTADISDLNPALHETAGLTKLTGDANSNAVIKEVVLRFGEAPIDLLYVDAAHDFSPTVINLGLYCMLLRPRLVVIDDIVLNAEMRTLWDAVHPAYGANAVNCVDIVRDIRGENVGFGLIRLR